MGGWVNGDVEDTSDGREYGADVDWVCMQTSPGGMEVANPIGTLQRRRPERKVDFKRGRVASTTGKPETCTL